MPGSNPARFVSLGLSELRDLLLCTLGDADACQRVHIPEQGLNNSTALFRTDEGSGYAIKFRPRAARSEVRQESAMWPSFTQVLFGPIPNGDLDTMPLVSSVLQAHGSIRTPRVLHVDDSMERVDAPFLINEALPGQPFDWTGNTMGEAAAAQLGEHLGRLHAGTAKQGFGVFEGPLFPAREWWRRFRLAFVGVLDQLCEH